MTAFATMNEAQLSAYISEQEAEALKHKNARSQAEKLSREASKNAGEAQRALLALLQTKAGKK